MYIFKNRVLIKPISIGFNMNLLVYLCILGHYGIHDLEIEFFFEFRKFKKNRKKRECILSLVLLHK